MFGIRKFMSALIARLSASDTVHTPHVVSLPMLRRLTNRLEQFRLVNSRFNVQ